MGVDNDLHARYPYRCGVLLILCRRFYCRFCHSLYDYGLRKNESGARRKVQLHGHKKANAKQSRTAFAGASEKIKVMIMDVCSVKYIIPAILAISAVGCYLWFVVGMMMDFHRQDKKR